MLTFKEFLDKYNGQQNVGNTPENTGQCVGLCEVWIDNLGLPHDWGNADQLLINADPNSFTVIQNTPEAIPSQGDIIVWGQQYNQTVGHCGIATGTGDTNTFEAFEQNDPIGSNCHLKTYNYAYVLGWLHPKNELDLCRTDRDKNWGIVVAVCNALGIAPDASDKVKLQQTILDAVASLQSPKSLSDIINSLIAFLKK